MLSKIVQMEVMKTLSILDVLSTIFTNISWIFLELWGSEKDICLLDFTGKLVAGAFKERRTNLMKKKILSITLCLVV